MSSICEQPKNGVHLDDDLLVELRVQNKNGTNEDVSVNGHESSSPLDSPVIVTRDNSDSCSVASRDSAVSLRHYDALLGELRCPGCARPMHAPIYLCKAGHSTCDLCTKTLNGCPLCNGDFTDIRSVTLEALAEKAYFLCKYSVNGCTVRLPYNLMRWHKNRCQFQVGECFMGKVWGGCSWQGCEIDWVKHCTDYHADKVHASDAVLLSWDYAASCRRQMKAVLGFYMVHHFGEVFNLYHVFDRPSHKSKWTMVCANKQNMKAYRNYAFQIELLVAGDPTRLLVQRHSCHGERDEDVLEEARCVCIDMGDVMRFMGPDKVLHYRVKVMDIRTLEVVCCPVANAIESATSTLSGDEPQPPSPPQQLSIAAGEPSPSSPFPPPTKTVCGTVECTNHKQVPEEIIIKRKSLMIATIEEEEFDISENSGGTAGEPPKRAVCRTSGVIVVHDHNNNNTNSSPNNNSSGSSNYSLCENNNNNNSHGKDANERGGSSDEDRPLRKSSRILKEVNGGYDSMKRIFSKSVSLDRQASPVLPPSDGVNRIQKPPRKFLTLNPKKAAKDNEFDLDELRRHHRRSSSEDLECCSLPDKIPTTPPPKKTPKKTKSIMNFVRSNLKF